MKLSGFIENEGIHRALSGGLPRSHAWILNGQRGSGRHTLANLMAQAFVCRSPHDQPCGVCPHCVKVAKGIHPDVSLVQRFMKEADAAAVDRELRVDAVRALRQDAFIRPNEAERKVYIIDRPLSTQDQNALLKLLEEGPEYAVFLILTDNVEKLLETVRSRCTELNCTPVSENGALRWLRSHYPDKDEETLRRAVSAGEGRIGRAVELLQDTTAEDALTPWVEDWCRAVLSRSELSLMECSVRMQTKKFERGDLEGFYRRLGGLFHQGLLNSYGLPAHDPLAEQLARTLTRKQLAALEELAAEGRLSLVYNVSVGHSAGWLAAKCAEIMHNAQCTMHN